MEILKHLLNPTIIIIIAYFVSSIAYCLLKYNNVNKHLTKLSKFLENYKKSDITYRFREFDEELTSNSYISNQWIEFRNTLIFEEKVALKDSKNEEMEFENITFSNTGIQTTVDSSYFFNEETLVMSKMNYKYIQAIPTLLTGLGPLFTFLHIALAFANVDFSSTETTMSSISHLMKSMQSAALCSVFAVAESLIFILFDRLSFNIKCKAPLAKIQDQLYKIFDSVSSEKFLIELLKTTKLQSHALSSSMQIVADSFKNSIEKSFAQILIPYLDNIVYNLDKIKEISANINTNTNVNSNSENSLDAVDDLF